MNKFIIALLLIVILGGGAWWYTTRAAAGAVGDTSPDVASQGGDATSGTQLAGSESMRTDTGSGALPLYSVSDVASHASAASCWSIIDGNVYDLTEWIGKHPGGEDAILGLCGIDGSAAFHGKHGSAIKQANMLATMHVGILAQ